MSTSFNKAGIVRVGVESTTSEKHMHQEVPGEKTQKRRRQDAISNPTVRSGEKQGSNAENTSLLSKMPVSKNGRTPNTSSQPVIPNAQVAVPAGNRLKQPTLALFNSLLEMTDFREIDKALQGFDINMRMENNRTMLAHIFIDKNLTRETMAFIGCLRQKGAEFYLTSEDFPKALRVAVALGDINLINILILTSEGQKAEKQHDALHYAVVSREPKLALQLLESMEKIDPSLISVPLLFAKAAILNNLDLMEEIFFLAKPDINATDMVNGHTPLQIAAGYGSTNIIDFLLRKGAEINPESKWHGNNALVSALHGLSQKTLNEFDKDEIADYNSRKLKAVQMLLDAKYAEIDFTAKIPEGPYTTRYDTLYGLAQKAGPEFVACLAEAHLRQASRRTGLPISAEGFQYQTQ
ncbi:ankyrin repeat domain-containing protein|uniref:ankyrin repeat domain-containing protein n=1 Tax=Noviherbaspirillum sp. L7-7A TaxID=2850560 RepID=UPI001C2C2A2F|nr:ankyrin repeat domain-containing protein [Noviherbaspirillum sp. L7-7A]MBV0880316.1 ankyrin repeat domain-containing protein [Noviherbaspirillum sp. L7-7A]